MARAAVTLSALTASVCLGAVHLPGSQPVDFAPGQAVDLWVNKLWSAKTQLTYNYYSLPVCQPEAADLRSMKITIGQIITGDRIMSSQYKLEVGKDSSCNVLCEKTYSADDVAVFMERIDNEYTVSWQLDGLPAAVSMTEEGEEEGGEGDAMPRLERNFPLGFSATPHESPKKRYYLFNHIAFVIHVHQEDGKDEVEVTDVTKATEAGVKYRIVGFVVEPFTVKHKKTDESKAEWVGNLATCNAENLVTREVEAQLIDEAGSVLFTYDVRWQSSATTWAERWMVYLGAVNEDDIHWFSIINSLMIVLFLTGMIAMILMRNLYRDIAKYNEETSAEEAAEETGWKLVHGDVFRPPAGFFGPMFLSVFVGSGMQILAMSFFFLIFAVLGFLSPANSGSLLTGFLFLFVFMGSFAGYFSARVYKMFKGKAWKRNTTLTAFAFPGTIFGIAFILNLFVWFKRSSLAVPIGTMLIIAALWVFVSVPLVFLGSYLGFRNEEIKHPVRVNNIPRQIPPQPWYLHPIPSVLVGGILPFGAVFIELFFIMSSIWLAQLYFVFGFLFLVLMILIVTCAEISIVMAYFQLCAEDYNWWWRSFLTSGSSALYLFAYSIVYFTTKLDITQPASVVLYFGYMGMAAWGFFLLTGSIGFVACLVFVNRIYGALKID